MGMDEAAVRYTNAVLIDDEQQTHLGDFLLHSDGSWAASKGDEDVVQNLDGSKKLITRSFQNWVDTYDLFPMVFVCIPALHLWDYQPSLTLYF